MTTYAVHPQETVTLGDGTVAIFNRSLPWVYEWDTKTRRAYIPSAVITPEEIPAVKAHLHEKNMNDGYHRYIIVLPGGTVPAEITWSRYDD